MRSHFLSFVLPVLVALSYPQAAAAQEILIHASRPDGHQCFGAGGSVEFREMGIGGTGIGESGYAVHNVMAGGPAAVAGLTVGDTIAAVNDSTIRASRFPLNRPGTRMRIRVRRNGMTRDTALVMGEYRTDSTGTQRCVVVPAKP